MRRVILWFNAGLLAAMVILAFAVWKLSQEKNRLLGLASQPASSLGPDPGEREEPGPTSSGSSEKATSSIEAVTISDATRPKEIAPEVHAERKRLSEEQRRRQSRLNAFNGYDEGFIALNLPPQLEALAKDTILRRKERMAAIKWNEESPQDVVTARKQVLETAKAEMIALVGEAAFEELEAHKIKHHFDWTIGTDLWDGGAPMSEQKLHALALAIVRLDYRDQLFGFELEPSQVPDAVTGLSSQDHLLLIAAKNFLSPLQQELLRQNLAEENRYNAAMRDRAAIQRQRQLRP